LSGLLADISEPPTTPLDFGNHLGLQMLYAERLVERPRASWIPQQGTTRQWIEYVFQEHNRLLPPVTIEEANGD
jgi:hypothetical protein